MGDNTTSIVIIILVVIIYGLPSMLASGKKHTAGIFFLNLFLGWTILGWIAALIWAVSSPRKEYND